MWIDQDLRELGRRIAARRKDLNLTQLQVTYHLSLGSIQTLSKWENGHQRPETDNLQALAELLQLSYTEQFMWFGLAGYIPLTTLPSREQIAQQLVCYSDDVAQDPFPSVVVDYRFTLWVLNASAVNVLGGYASAAAILAAHFPTVLDVVFRDEVGISNFVTSNLDQARRLKVRLFKLYNINRRHEPFYRRFLDLMREHLGPCYPKFEQVWRATDIGLEPIRHKFNEGIVEVSGYLTPEEESPLVFKLRLEPTFHFPQFAIMRWYPAVMDAEIARQIEGINSQRESDQAIRLWEVADVQPLLDRYQAENSLRLVEE